MIPALLVAGALAAGPASTPAGPVSPPAVVTVDAGDTLWAITGAAFGDPAEWPRLYARNLRVIGSDPDRIYPGERIELALAPRPMGERAIMPAAVTAIHSDNDGRQAANSAGGQAAGAGRPSAGGTLGCSGLEQLWTAAGGPRRAAFTAAEVAMAESGGRQYATGHAGERGYWQINPDHGALSTYDPYGNARAAVIISSWGRDWSPWTTYTRGLYAGLC